MQVQRACRARRRRFARQPRFSPLACPPSTPIYACPRLSTPTRCPRAPHSSAQQLTPRIPLLTATLMAMTLLMRFIMARLALVRPSAIGAARP